MYCKHCGKQIDDNSNFCQHCGSKQDIVDKFDEQRASEVIVETKEGNALQIEISRKKHVFTIANETIANEIVGNLKMILLAVLLILVIGFTLFHIRDISKFDCKTHTLGESCYDPWSENLYLLHWEQHYYKALNEYVNYDSWGEGDTDYNNIPPKKCLEYAKDLENDILWSYKYYKHNNHGYRYWRLPNFKEMRKDAKKEAVNDRQSWNNYVNRCRKEGYIEELKKNVLYVALFSFILTIFGRYLVILTKWVNANRTKNRN